ncbi:25-diamino-6-ribosylamino-4 [Meyerozyma sp. JA9]|nr:25-diamino-6-ribosylamino-4 [Meyerozyma sp. JA9]
MDPPPASLLQCIHPYLPHTIPHKPFVTLTYAQSLDSRIAAAPGTQTKISGAATKSMTHYIRSKHDAIMVGIGTVLADDPKLNCRHEGGKSPRPVVLDPHGKWDYKSSQLRQLVDNSTDALAPYIIVAAGADIETKNEAEITRQRGKYIRLALSQNRLQNWHLIFDQLDKLSISSVMIEGGAQIINDLLSFQKTEPFVDSLIITIGPVYLGEQGVQVSPPTGVVPTDCSWWTGSDCVMCSRIGRR